mmetsp:Transcript_10506/g.21869  ORF Transcript_10506/g.21869 Transcript_10506/m.21869 type:complete len:298 (+) Transcript_10506:1610-2503(+)
MGFVVASHLGQWDVASGGLQWHVMQVRMVIICQQLLQALLDLSRLGIVLRVQSCALLGLQALQFQLQLRSDVLVLKQALNTISFGSPRDLTQHAVQLLLDLRNTRLAQGVVEGVRHQTFVQAQVTLICLRSQVGIDLHALVDVVEKLRSILPCPCHNGRWATWMSVHELRQVIDFAVQRHPAILGDAVAVHFAQRDVPGNRHGRCLLQQALLPLRHRSGHTAVVLALMGHLDMNLQFSLLREGFVAISASQEGVGIVGTMAPWVLIAGRHSCHRWKARRQCALIGLIRFTGWATTAA